MDPLLMLQWLIWNEGYCPQVYSDTLGLRTVGIGLLLDDPQTKTLSPGVQARVDGALGAGRCLQIYNGSVMTPAEIKTLYDLSFASAHSTVQQLYPNYASFGNAQQIVLHDLAFNMGLVRLRGFVHMNGYINTPPVDWASAAYELKNSDWYNQVGDRAGRDYNAMQSNALPPIPHQCIDDAALLM